MRCPLIYLGLAFGSPRLNSARHHALGEQKPHEFMRRISLTRDDLGALGLQQIEFGSAFSIGKDLPQLAHARNHARKSLVEVIALLSELKRRRLNIVKR